MAHLAFALKDRQNVLVESRGIVRCEGNGARSAARDPDNRAALDTERYLASIGVEPTRVTAEANW